MADFDKTGVWETDLIRALGKRYREGPKEALGISILHRHGKERFLPTRVYLEAQNSQPGRLFLEVDFRVPTEAGRADADELRDFLETTQLATRGFERSDLSESKMTSERGDAAGWVQTARYVATGISADVDSLRVRSIVDSLDIPVVIGVHAKEDLIIREPPKQTTPVQRQILDPWFYTLVPGFGRKVVAKIDPNERTLQVYKQRFLKREILAPEIKLARLRALGIKGEKDCVSLFAVPREGVPEVIIDRAEVDLSTLQRLAEKIFLPLVQC